MKQVLARWLFAWQSRVGPSELALFVAITGVAFVSSLIGNLLMPISSLGSFLLSAIIFGIFVTVSYSVVQRIIANSTHHRLSAQLLNAREQRLYSIAAALPDRTVILDADGSYRDVLKPDYETAPIWRFGGDRGTRIQDRFPEAFANFCLKVVREVIETNSPQILEYEIDFLDAPYILEGRIFPFKDPDSGEPRVIWISRDITERKQMERRLVESERLLRTVFGALPDRTLVFDAEGNYHEVLQTAFHTTHNLEALQRIQIGHSIRSHFPPEFAEFCIEQIRKTIDTGTMQVFDYPSPFSEIKQNHFEAHTIPFNDPVNGESRVLWVTRDITARQQAEQRRLELALQHEHFEFFRQFVDHMTHDLKTPLTMIKTSLYFVERSDDADDHQRQIDNIHQQVFTLNQMIDDMLMIGRLDVQPVLDFDIVDFLDLLQEIVQQLRPQAQIKGQQLELRPQNLVVNISAAKNELSRALTNLISNAIKYTPVGGQITITAQVENEELVLRVQDTGIGIAAEDIPQIFDRFYRSSSGRKTASGTGLGLAIVKRIIDLHDGEIDVESVVGQGSTFSVRLPVQHQEVNTNPASTAQ